MTNRQKLKVGQVGVGDVAVRRRKYLRESGAFESAAVYDWDQVALADACIIRYDVHTSPTADAALCTLSFASGVIGALHAYHVPPYRHALNLFGTRVNLYRDSRFFDEGTHLELQRVHPQGEYEAREPLSFDRETDWCGNLRAFHKGITEGGPFYPSLREAARAIAIIFAAGALARAGGPPVTVPDVPELVWLASEAAKTVENHL